MTIKIYLFDTPESHDNLLPLSFTRPVADFRVGIMTVKEKWEKMSGCEIKFLPVDYLKSKFGDIENAGEECLFIAGDILPDENVVEEVLSLEKGIMLVKEGFNMAFRGTGEEFVSEKYSHKEYREEIKRIGHLYDIFLENYSEIKKDFKLLTRGRQSKPLPDCTRLIGDLKGEDDEPLLFIEEGAEVECVTINVKKGPVYIGKDAILMEGSCLRGPLAVCEGTKIRMGAKIYGGTTFGPYCKIGGEVDNCVIFGYSNKAHDGYLGNAVIGEWCNIGAGVNASNLKNDYSKIRLWNYRSRSFERTDLQFCGLIMGDHSKIGVNCMINTATVIGVGVNMHGSGFPRVFVRSFSEGSPSAGFNNVIMKKFEDTAGRVMSRRGKILDEESKNIFKKVFEEENK